MDAKSLLNFVFSSLKNSSSKVETMDWRSHGNNIPDEIKMILLSQDSLEPLEKWDSKKPSIELIKILKSILLVSNVVPELSYNILSECGYFNQVLRIYFSCLNYLKEQTQDVIDNSCALSIVISNVAKYARKFCIRYDNTLSSFGNLFFKQALTFLRCKGFEFAWNPNNCVYILAFTNTMNYLMSLQREYKSLFIELNGIQYCLGWLSKRSKEERNQNFYQNLYYDLRILSILENFVDDPYFAEHKMVVVMRITKYLRSNGDLMLSSTFLPESCLVFECVCRILINMAMKIKGSRRDINAYNMKPLLISFLTKYKICIKMIYTTILVLEEDIEDYDDVGSTEVYCVMSKCERLSNTLQLSEIYNIASSNDIKFHQHQLNVKHSTYFCLHC